MNPRPFDSNDRPRKGEWIRVTDSSGNNYPPATAGGSSAMASGAAAFGSAAPMAAPTPGTNYANYGGTLGDAGTYQAPTVTASGGLSKVLMAVIGIAVLVVAGLAFAIMQGQSKSSNRTKAVPSSQFDETNNSGTFSTAKEPPELGSTIKKYGRDGKDVLLAKVSYNLNQKGAKLNPTNPIKFEPVVGGSLISAEVEGNEILLRIRMTGEGNLTIIGLNQVGTIVNTNKMRGSRSVTWADPTPSVITTHSEGRTDPKDKRVVKPPKPTEVDDLNGGVTNR